MEEIRDSQGRDDDIVSDHVAKGVFPINEKSLGNRVIGMKTSMVPFEPRKSIA